MKQESHLDPTSSDSEMDTVLSSTEITQDVVEEFARQLDEVVRIQDEQQQQQQQSDSDDDDGDAMFGYQQLPQDDEDGMYGQLASEDEEEGAEYQDGQMDISEPLQLEISPSDQLKPETSDLIKSIMSNIQLSDNGIPDWAKKIPEEAWLPRTAPEKK